MTEVHGDAELHPGDRVQFVVVKNQRNGKYSACSLRKIMYVYIVIVFVVESSYVVTSLPWFVFPLDLCLHPLTPFVTFYQYLSYLFAEKQQFD